MKNDSNIKVGDYIEDCNYYAVISTVHEYHTCGKYKLQSFESKSKRTLERAEAFIKLQNWADKNTGMFKSIPLADKHICEYYIQYNYGKITISWYIAERRISAINFSSKEIAQQAIDHFGEDFIKLYLGV